MIPFAPKAFDNVPLYFTPEFVVQVGTQNFRRDTPASGPRLKLINKIEGKSGRRLFAIRRIHHGPPPVETHTCKADAAQAVSPEPSLQRLGR